MHNRPVSSIYLKYGAFSGLGLFLMFLLVYFSGHNPLGNWSWAGSWVPYVFMVLAVKEYKDQNNSQISFWKAVSLCFSMLAASALLYESMVYMFTLLINPGIVDQFKEEFIQSLEKSRAFLSETMYETSLENTEKLTIGTIVSSDFFTKIFFGFFVILIIAGIMKNNNPAFTEENHEHES